METLSTSVSVSTFRPPATATSTSALPHPTFKPPSSSNHLHLLSRRNSLSNSNNHQHQQPLINPTNSQSTILPKPSSYSPTAATKASSGYAAALLDISICQNSIQLVFKDATRFANLIRAKPVLELMRNPFIDAMEKNRALKELIENGKFEKHFAALLKMLIVKNNFAIIGDVLDEFRRMYYELCAGNSRASVVQ